MSVTHPIPRSGRITRQGWLVLLRMLVDLWRVGTWRYLLAPYDGWWLDEPAGSRGGWRNGRGRPCRWSWPGWLTVWCRATGHRDVGWYNPGALEPDMDCLGCGENLG